MAIEWTPPQGEYVNEGATARQWMTPGGEYLMEPGDAATGQPAGKRMGGVQFAHGGYQPGSGTRRW